ncbi:MAG: hypothetical protein WC716_02960 [Chitinophagaceae bacterium]|jgi:hypothetical protein
MENYLFEEHAHHFAVWTAARAVSRNFTTTLNVKNAIDSSGLRKFAGSLKECSQNKFDKLHRDWASQIIKSLEASKAKGVSYGRAAKIISIYLKTSVVLVSKGLCQKSTVIHPPIDAILLGNLLSELPQLTYLKGVKWTQLDEEKYWELVARLRKDLGRFDWKVEFYWKP